LSLGNKKTVLRTIRVTKELDEALQTEAREESLSLNALLSMVLVKHVDFERFADQYRIVSISRELLRAILDSTEEEKLHKAMEDVTGYLPRDIIAFRAIKPNIEAFIHGVETTFKYGRLAECKIHQRSQNEIVVSLHHDLGLRWSKIMTLFLSEITKATFGQTPKFECAKSSVIAIIPVGNSQSI
jgi:hypothetical protein